LTRRDRQLCARDPLQNFELAVRPSLCADRGARRGNARNNNNQILRLTFLDGTDAGLLGARRDGSSICGCVLGGTGGARVRFGHIHGDGGLQCVVRVKRKKKSVAGESALTERRWSPSSYSGLAQTSWQISDVDLQGGELLRAVVW